MTNVPWPFVFRRLGQKHQQIPTVWVSRVFDAYMVWPSQHWLTELNWKCYWHQLEVPEKATRNVTERFRTSYTILPANVSDTQIIQDAEKKGGWLCGKHMLGIVWTMANPYGLPMKKSGLLPDPDLICWEIFTVKIQTGNVNKNNGVHQTTQCSHASRAPFLWCFSLQEAVSVTLTLVFKCMLGKNSATLGVRLEILEINPNNGFYP